MTFKEALKQFFNSSMKINRKIRGTGRKKEEKEKKEGKNNEEEKDIVKEKENKRSGLKRKSKERG